MLKSILILWWNVHSLFREKIGKIKIFFKKKVGKMMQRDTHTHTERREEKRREEKRREEKRR